MSKFIYDLNFWEFEKLIAQLLGEKYNVVVKVEDNIRPSGDRPVSHWDLSFEETNGTKTIVEVKHKKKLSLADLKAIHEQVKQYNRDFNKGNFILATSASVSSQAKEEFQEIFKDTFKKATLLDGKEIEVLIKTHNNIASLKATQINYITKFKRQKRLQAVGNFLAATLSVFSVLTIIKTSIISTEDKRNLDKGITNVEKALESIKNLESDLKNIKEDMVETSRKSELIMKKYKHAQTLKDISDKEIESFKKLLGQESPPWWRRILDQLLGLILGISGSYIANIFWEKRKIKKELEKSIS